MPVARKKKGAAGPPPVATPIVRAGSKGNLAAGVSADGGLNPLRKTPQAHGSTGSLARPAPINAHAATTELATLEKELAATPDAAVVPQDTDRDDIGSVKSGVSGVSSGQEDVEVFEDLNEEEQAQFKELLERLQFERDVTETHLRRSQAVIHFEDEENYIHRNNVAALQHMKEQHQRERKRMRTRHDAERTEMRSHNEMNRMQMKLLRDAQVKQARIHEQNEIRELTVAARMMVQQRRASFENRVHYIERQQERERQELAESQRRKARVTKMMLALETKYMPRETRKVVISRAQLLAQNQESLDSRRALHLRDLQLLGMKNRKAEFEIEIRNAEQREALQLEHRLQRLELEDRQAQEMDKLLVVVQEKQTEIKVQKAVHLRDIAMGQLRKQQRKDYRVLEKQQNYARQVRLQQFKAEMEDDDEAIKSADRERRANGDSASERSGNEEDRQSMGSGGSRKKNPLGGSDGHSAGSMDSASFQGTDTADAALTDTQAADFKNQLMKAQEMITERQARHQKEMRRLLADQQVELTRSDQSFKVRLKDLRDEQEEELKNMKAEHAAELEAMIGQQQQDLAREQQVQEAETTMMRESRKLQSVLDTVVDAIITMTPDGTILVFNPAAAGMFGFAPEEIVGKNITMMLPHEHRKNHHKYVERYLQTGVAHIIGKMRRLEGMRRNGERFMLHLSLSEVKTSSYHIFTGIIRDITEQIAKERDIQLEKEKLMAVMSSINDCVITSNTEGIITSFNAAAERQFGYHRNEVIGKNVRVLVPDDIRDQHDTFVQNYLRTGVARVLGGSRRVQARNKSGTLFDCLISLSEVKGDGFHIFTGILRDISEELRSQAAIRSQGEQLQAIRKSLNDALITITPDGTVQAWSQASERLLGYTAQEMIGQNVSRICPPEHKQLHNRHIQRYLDTGEAHVIGDSRFLTAEHKDGSIVPVKLSLCEARGHGFHVFTALLQDLTEEKKREQELLVSQKSMAAIIELTLDPFFAATPQGNIVFANAACKSVLQLDPAEAKGKHVSVFVQEKQHKELEELLADAVASAGARQKAGESRAAVRGLSAQFDGFTWKQRRVILQVSCDAVVVDGEVMLVVTMRDETDEVEDRSTVVRRNKQLFSSLNLITHPVIVTDMEFNVKQWNEVSATVLKMSKEQLGDTNMVEILPNSDRRSAIPSMPVIGDDEGLKTAAVLGNGTKHKVLVHVYQTEVNEEGVEESLTWTLRKV